MYVKDRNPADTRAAPMKERTGMSDARDIKLMVAEAQELLKCSCNTLAANLPTSFVTSEGIKHGGGDLTPALRLVQDAIHLLEDAGCLPRWEPSIRPLSLSEADPVATNQAQIYEPGEQVLWKTNNPVSPRGVFNTIRFMAATVVRMQSGEYPVLLRINESGEELPVRLDDVVRGCTLRSLHG